MSTFSRKTVGGVVALGAGSFVLALVFAAFSDDLGDPRSAGADVFSRSALGHHAFAELLRRESFEVSIRRTERPGTLGPDTPLILAEPPRPRRGAEQTRLADHLLGATSLGATPVVVLPKWQGIPLPQRPGWLVRVDPLIPDHLEQVIEAVEPQGDVSIRLVAGFGDLDATCETAWLDAPRVVLTRAQLLRADEGLEPLVTCEGRVLVARANTAFGEVVLVSDPDVINNHGLGRGDNARVMHGLLARELDATGVVIDETVHGFSRATGLLSQLFRFPLVLAVLHGAGLLTLVLWAGTGRFGKPRPVKPPLGSGKRVLIDNTAQLLGVTGHTADTLPRYFRTTIRAVAAHYFLPADLSEEQLIARLKEIGRGRGLDYDLERAAREVRLVARGESRRAERAVRLALELHRYRERMTDVD